MRANRFKSWTENEERLLVALHESGMNHRLIALKLRRTEAGVDNRLAQIIHRPRPAEDGSRA
ncbi:MULTISPECIES: hypothetical protein [Bradyrhizobium]|uniref:hypothetical protein n=1 Tax=Bradyrhizobium TaxID=374 RepID=UPI00067E03D2|nr:MULTISPECIES: hypothetical protein [Bradyrhizobium]OKO74793.1 hypothetical protein AC628_22025 [Bradyrhizobium sp. NAS96.2]